MTLTEAEKLNKLGIQFIKALTDMVNAHTRLISLSNEKFIDEPARFVLKRVSGHVGNGVTQFKKFLSPEDRELFEQEALDPSVSLQIEALRDMLVDLPQGIRDQCESYISAQHRVYGSKINQN